MQSEHGFQRCQQHRHIFRLAARHYRVDRYFFDGAGGEVRRNPADDFIGLACGAFQHAHHAHIGGWCDRQAITPAALITQLHRINIVAKLHFARGKVDAAFVSGFQTLGHPGLE